MASPRWNVPDAWYLVTRRCEGREFRLRPSPRTNRVFVYCLAIAAARAGVRVVAVGVMSNHYHAVVHDPEGRIAVFLQELHRLVAKCLSAMQGRWGGFWSRERASLVRLGDEDDVIAKIAYLAANPVEAGLVATPSRWPGVMLLPRAGAYEVGARRPEGYFAANGGAPARARLRIEALGFANAEARVGAAIAEAVSRAQARMRAAGERFLGRAAVLGASFAKRARSLEKRRALVPGVAARRVEMRKELLEGQRAFRVAYREALERWRRGEREVVFPWGTWWMRVFHGAAVAAPA
jgi:REP element-mobilizing transposase RayT